MKLDFSAKRISKEKFFQFIGRILPKVSEVPWDCCQWQFVNAIGILVYRVDGIPAGKYMLFRHSNMLDQFKVTDFPQKPEMLIMIYLQELTKSKSYIWRKLTPEECAYDFPLYLLEEGSSFAKLAEEISCHQHLVNQASFCLCMFVNVADFVQTDLTNYRRMHWECGILGQVCYNEATALQIKATGLGCFIDDLSQTAFGLDGSHFQPLYHFTAGVPERDMRYPPYHYEKPIFELLEDD